ncbi:winged helix-turn-helix transcriptional regulator [Rhizorhabdus wittichii]|uniref:Winged helix-turn-helix transcriptional regulator n=1 Tax=Rhizorhabdus wittichii TaxID=160791 RepID=A0A975HBS3_9SPHN|nr:MarR family winged helix-turn-helix transcriptional regulator [Rhizorhabdus wittichii]QTH19621.1 winged helix-turn-helix transcriptional regulator [Rhizorhabdus wittichii]
MADLATLSLAWLESPAYVELTTRQTAILAIVCDWPGDHTVRSLAQRLGVSKPVVTRALNSFGRLGLVKRVGDPDDRRVIFAVPTDAGRAARQAMRELAHG